ncbi:MAG: hypothetical protein IJD11_04125, partial [Oscillospiraceae bacterium]|nr:hypothetical protein [Oscillospiraceae bacterium]
MIITASSFIGGSLSSNLSKRVNELENAILLLEQMETCLRYGQIPTFEMLERLSDSGSFGGCTYLNQCFGRVKSGWQFPQAWRKSVQEERSGLGK